MDKKKCAAQLIARLIVIVIVVLVTKDWGAAFICYFLSGIAGHLHDNKQQGEAFYREDDYHFDETDTFCDDNGKYRRVSK